MLYPVVKPDLGQQVGSPNWWAGMPAFPYGTGSEEKIKFRLEVFCRPYSNLLEKGLLQQDHGSCFLDAISVQTEEVCSRSHSSSIPIHAVPWISMETWA